MVTGATTTKTGQKIGNPPTTTKVKESQTTIKEKRSTPKNCGAISIRNTDTQPIGVLRIQIELEAKTSSSKKGKEPNQTMRTEKAKAKILLEEIEA